MDMEQISTAEATFGDLAVLNDQRAGTYGLLARLFRGQVDEAFEAELRAMRWPAQTGNDAADQGYRLIATYLSATPAGCTTDLAQDFTRCFIGQGMSSFSAAYPFESVHTSEKRLLMQDARDEVMAIMRSEGVEKRPDFHDSEDHIAVELEFMEVLAQRTAAALRAGDEATATRLLTCQRNFLEDHLASWVPLLASDMRTFAKTNFYQGLSYVTEGFLAEDGAYLAEAVVEETAPAPTA